MNEKYPFVNPPLPYAYDSMEPYIDAKTMELHHDRHLQTYVDKLNEILKDYPEYQSLSLEQLLMAADSLPLEIQTQIRDNAGGVYNHIFYLENLKNAGMEIPPEPLREYMNSEFGTYEIFQSKLAEAALSVFGSGYAWLVIDAFGNPKIITTKNQDTPFEKNMYPLLNIDVWEHAYYLKHYNKRTDYIKDWLQVVNWDQINQNFIRFSEKYLSQL